MLRALSTVLIVAGALLLADAGVTLLWQEPLSALYAHVQQSKLERRARRSSTRVPPTPVEQRALAKLPDPHAPARVRRARARPPHRRRATRSAGS